MEHTSQELRYLSRLSAQFPTVAAAASEIIRIEAILRLPKGTEHFMSDLHGENEAFIHILNNASGYIREKIDTVFGDELTPSERADLATLIYYPEKKLPALKLAQSDLPGWYHTTLMRLIRLCRFVSSKHTRAHVRRCLPASCAYVLDELLHAHFEDHDKKLYYETIVDSIIAYRRADAYIIRFCELIKRLAVDRLHIVGDLFDRGPRPDLILERLIEHHDVDVQWGNHDVVWMGAAAGSPVCVLTVLKTTLAYNNTDTVEHGYGIGLRELEHFAASAYEFSDVMRWLPKTDDRRPTTTEKLYRVAQMHKAVTVMLLKVEARVIARNPDFQMSGRDYINRIDFEKGTVNCAGRDYPLLDSDFPTVDPDDPTALSEGETEVLRDLIRGFRHSKLLRKHIEFIYSVGSVYKVTNGNLLYHGAVPMTEDGEFAKETFEGREYSGRALFDYCDRRARQGYFAPEGSPERLAGQDFLWYLWCGRLSPIYGRSAMTTFERLYIADEATHKEVKNPYYRLTQKPGTAEKILKEFGLTSPSSKIINGHVPVRALEGESPVKGGGKLIVIDGGFCRAYHEKTGIAGYTLVYNSRGLTLRTHQPFESAARAIEEDEDISSSSEYIYTAPSRLLVADTDEGEEKRALIEDLKLLVRAYQTGLIRENP